MMPAVLVTGGAGYIGSHISLALATGGFLPVTYDTLERGHRWAVQWGPLEVGDVRDTARLSHAIAAHRPVAVMHLAAYALVAESFQAPQLYSDNNVEGTRSLLAAMAGNGVIPLIFSSSCSVYGEPATDDVDERHDLAPASPYGASKQRAEEAIQSATARGIRHTILRYFNAAGADPEARIGEAHATETHLIPLALEAATGAARPLTVHGSDYPTPDGTCVRDYVHVMDIAAAHVLALRRLLAGGASTTCNLGSGQGHSVRQVIDTAQRVTGRRIPHSFGPRRAGDPPRAVANVALAAAELGWRPTHSLTDQISDAWRWMQKFRGPQPAATGSALTHEQR